MAGSIDEMEAVWEAALDWLLRIQAAPGDRGLTAARDAWIAAGEARAQAYRLAEKTWRLTGCVPPATCWDGDVARALRAALWPVCASWPVC